MEKGSFYQRKKEEVQRVAGAIKQRAEYKPLDIPHIRNLDLRRDYPRGRERD